MNVLHFKKKKELQEKITMITCYDTPTAKIIEQAITIDCVLVGDSVATVIHGYNSTIHATIEMMCLHTSAVARGLKTKFLIADLPFLSYRKSLETTLDNIQRLMQAGAQAVKLEGCNGNLKTIECLVQAGVPVFGHLGLTPQSIHNLGGHKVQGKNEADANTIIKQAKQLENAGCACIILECIPPLLAKSITDNIHIPTIGIGAGPHCDGQVLVLHDLLGFDKKFKPKFLKQYANTHDVFLSAITDYGQEVKHQEFPLLEAHCY